MKRVAVIIPTHNRSDLLAITLHNVRCQSHTDLDVIVVDDASTDDTPEVLARTVRDDSRFRSVKFETSRGACAARNTGLSMTSADYVCLLDADDLIHPDKLAIQVAELEADRSLDATVCQMAHFEHDPNEGKLLWNTFAGAEPRRRFLGHDPAWGIHAPLWRREILQNLGGLDESLPVAQDYELHLRALLKGVRFGMRPQLLSFCRRHRGPAISTSKALPRLKTLANIFRQCEPDLHSEETNVVAANFIWLARQGAIMGDPDLVDASISEARRFGLHPPASFGFLCRLSARTGRHRFMNMALRWADSNNIDWRSREGWYLVHRVDDEPNLERFDVPQNTFTPPST